MRIQAIDDSNRDAHYYLTAEDECYFLHEFTARKGFNYSPGNQFIYNLKKSPAKKFEAQYSYKLAAIQQAISIYRQIFSGSPEFFEQATLAPIPPSKRRDHPEYDDRMWQIVQGLALGTPADARELIYQQDSYEAAHLAGDGGRIKPHELQALYQVDPRAPRQIVALFDDVLSAGCHFRAAKDSIVASYPGARVVGFFLARRVLPDPAEIFAGAL